MVSTNDQLMNLSFTVVIVNSDDKFLVINADGK